MSDFRVASRYAKSLLYLAIELKTEDKLVKDMQLISETCEQNRDLVMVLKNPVIKYDKKLNILKKLFGKNVNPLVIRFMELLSRKNRANILPDITKSWIDQYNEHKNILIARITSSTSLTESGRTKILEAVKKSTGKSVIMEEAVSKELIGGFILKIKDQQLDNSVRGQLNRLKRKFLNKA